MQINNSDYYKIDIETEGCNKNSNNYDGYLYFESYFGVYTDVYFDFFYNFEENEYKILFDCEPDEWRLQYKKEKLKGKLNENEKNYITFKINTDEKIENE